MWVMLRVRLCWINANDLSLYRWSLSGSLTGEVYASRAEDVNWSNINCSYDNATHWEMKLLNHTNSNDNISMTFSKTNNSEFVVGTC